ncbi:hypothetical protein T01_14716 [Trichinella spiralis]|uniref:Uncharacterized protein n=1 Tax=Trichinella spiralis TaxID=6334 RepID=A0A0V1ATK7_TRISP|nr:hypothetical protein T01_12355 [Trichinella spiralis]KRY27652.1 hypothetical protein T01_14716 [Trichinella spiralis]
MCFTAIHRLGAQLDWSILISSSAFKSAQPMFRHSSWNAAALSDDQTLKHKWTLVSADFVTFKEKSSKKTNSTIEKCANALLIIYSLDMPSPWVKC